ncbi:MAG: hypothetical protein R3F35_15320 [Myxococcota bacterium]
MIELLRPGRIRVLWLLVAVACIGARSATAQVFYDDLGSVDVFDDADVVALIGDHSSALGGSDWFQGFRFTSEATGTLHSIDVAVGNYFAGPQTIEFRLYADTGGALGAQLATVPVLATAEDFDGTIRRGFVELGAGSPPVLVQGASYWLMATSEGPTIWFQNEQGVSLPRLWTEFGPGAPLNSDTTIASAFRLNGPPAVPLANEGSVLVLVLALLGAGSGTLGSLARDQGTAGGVGSSEDRLG